MLVTGSWDKTVRFWDCRTPKAAFIINTPDRVYAMDCTAPLLTVATANRKVIMYDTQKLQQPRRVRIRWALRAVSCLILVASPFQTLDSPLKFQTRSIANFMSKDGFAIGSIEGRVAIQHVDERSQYVRLATPTHSCCILITHRMWHVISGRTSRSNAIAKSDRVMTASHSPSSIR